MSFIAKYHNDCSFCGEELKDTEATYANDQTLVHISCLIPYNTGADPLKTALHRNEKTCPDCFLVHAGDCL